MVCIGVMHISSALYLVSVPILPIPITRDPCLSAGFLTKGCIKGTTFGDDVFRREKVNVNKVYDWADCGLVKWFLLQFFLPGRRPWGLCLGSYTREPQRDKQHLSRMLKILAGVFNISPSSSWWGNRLWLGEAESNERYSVFVELVFSIFHLWYCQYLNVSSEVEALTVKTNFIEAASCVSSLPSLTPVSDVWLYSALV